MRKVTGPAWSTSRTAKRRRSRPGLTSGGGIESLENRQLLTFSASLAGNVATLVGGGPGSNAVNFVWDGNNVSHGPLTAPQGQQFADDLDFDSTTPGSQRLSSSPGTRVNVSGGDFAVVVGSVSAPAQYLGTRFDLVGSRNSSLEVINNSSDFFSELALSRSGDELRLGRAFVASDVLVSFNEAGFQGGFRVDAGPLGNRLSVDLAGKANPIPLSGMTYVSQGRANLNLFGDPADGPVASEVIQLDSTTSGRHSLDGRTVNFSGIYGIYDVVRAASTNYDLSVVDPRSVTIRSAYRYDDPSNPNLRVTIDQSLLNASDFGSKGSLAVKLGSGDSTVDHDDSPTATSQPLRVDGGAGDDSFVFRTTSDQLRVEPGGTPGEVAIARPEIGRIVLADFETVSVVGSRLAPLPASSIRAVAGTSLTNVEVASFRVPLDLRSVESPGIDPFAATIDWGDGTSSTGVIVADGSDPSRIHVLGSHAYRQGGPAGVQTITVTVVQPQDIVQTVNGVPITLSAADSTPTVITTAAEVAPAPLTATGTTLVASAGQTLSDVTVGSFTSANPALIAGLTPLAIQSIQIDWGDGSTSTGYLRLNGGAFDIVGSHTYATYGSFPVAATVVNRENQVDQAVTARSVANVSDAPLAATPKLDLNGNPVGPAGSAFNAAVWSFVTSNGLIDPADYRATIDWGDGTTSEGFVSRPPGEVTLYVFGRHTYARPGRYQTIATISGRRPGGSTASSESELDASGSTLTTTSTSPVVAVRTRPFSGVLTTFASSNPLASVDQFAVSIDWGDQTSPGAGVVTRRADGTFEVSGTHTYLSPVGPLVGPPGSPIVDGLPPAPVVVTVRELGGGSTLTSESPLLNVFDAPITAQGTTVTGIAGAPLRQRVLANFQYTIGLNQSPDLYAFVNWGDGTSETLTGFPVYFIGESGGNALGQVAAGHTYAAAGTYAISVSITSSFGGGAVVSSLAVVEPAPAPITVAGGLSPASDTGVSNSDGITRDNRPVFNGTATPGAAISLFSGPAGSGATPTLIGQGTAGADGAWSITATTLADGAYTILAVAGLPGSEGVVTQILPDATRGVLVIDTVGPRVTGTRFLPFTGRVETTFQDDRSGLAQSSLTNPANYGFRRVGNLTGQGGLRGAARYAVNGVSTTANPDPTAAQLVLVTLNNNRTIPNGAYRYTVLSGGVTDVAGNPLGGSFSGSFPTTGQTGDFAADLARVNRRVLPPLAVGSTGDSLTPAGKRQLAKILTAFGSGRTSGTKAADQIARLPRRVTASVAVATPSGGLVAKLRGGKVDSSR